METSEYLLSKVGTEIKFSESKDSENADSVKTASIIGHIKNFLHGIRLPPEDMEGMIQRATSGLKGAYPNISKADMDLLHSKIQSEVADKVLREAPAPRAPWLLAGLGIPGAYMAGKSLERGKNDWDKSKYGLGGFATGLSMPLLYGALRDSGFTGMGLLGNTPDQQISDFTSI